MRYFGSIIILLFVVTIVSCKKEKEVQTIAVNSHLKDAFDRKIGSYWVYRDSLSGRIDSFSIAYRSEGGQLVDNGSLDYSRIGLTVMKYNIGPTPAQPYVGTWHFQLEDDDLILFSTVLDDGSSDVKVTLYPILNYPYQDSIVSSTGYPTTRVSSIQKIGDYAINGFTFSNAAIATHSVDTSVNYTFYFSPDVGFFKMRLFDSEHTLNRVWELIRYELLGE